MPEDLLDSEEDTQTEPDEVDPLDDFDPEDDVPDNTPTEEDD